MKDVIIKAIEEKLQAKGFSGVSVLEKVVEKPYDSYNGLVIKVNECELNPTVNLDCLMSEIEMNKGDEKSMDEILSSCVDSLEKALKKEFSFDVEGIMDYSNIKDILYIRVCNQIGNETFLSKVPHIKKADLAFYPAFVLLFADGSEGIVNIEYPLLSFWNVTEEQLFEDAFISAQKHCPMEFAKIPNTEDACGNAGWVCAATGSDGFSAISYPGFYERVKEETGMNEFYIVPHSRRLSYLIPVSSDTPEDRLLSINAMEECLRFFNQVSEPEDVLSHQLYFCDTEGDFRIAKEACA